MEQNVPDFTATADSSTSEPEPIDSGFDTTNEAAADAVAFIEAMGLDGEPASHDAIGAGAGEALQPIERATASGEGADFLRADLVTAEVAAVLSLIAQDYFARSPERGEKTAKRSVPSAEIKRLPVRSGPRVVRETGLACTVIAFPGPDHRRAPHG